ncbi:MAG: hypothetical protein ACI8RD_000592, partial [Bacillariaceae sp.]
SLTNNVARYRTVLCVVFCLFLVFLYTPEINENHGIYNDVFWTD